MKKMMLVGLLLLVASFACSLGAGGVPATPHAIATGTREALTQGTPLPTATALPVTNTPSPQPPTPTPLPPLEAGAPIHLQSFDMMDQNNGWSLDVDRRILYTRDGGRSWQDVSPRDSLELCRAFFLDAQTAWLVRCGDRQNAVPAPLVRTLDGGQTWVVMNKDFRWFIGYSSLFSFKTAEQGLATTYEVAAGNGDASFSKTLDGGMTWSRIMFSPPPDYGGRSPIFDGDLAACNICGDLIYYDLVHAIIIHGNEASDDPNGAVSLAVSLDTGKTWKELSLPLPAERYKDYFITPQDPIFFDRERGILPVRMIKRDENGDIVSAPMAFYFTHDGGLTWQASPQVFEGANLAYLKKQDFVSRLNAFVACGHFSLCVTHDGAQHWEMRAVSLASDHTWDDWYIKQTDFVSPTAGWVLLDNNAGAIVFGHTSNGGRTWQEIQPIVIGR